MTVPVRIGIDTAFRAEAAAISPANAYSAMSQGRARERPLSAADWTARETADGTALEDALLRQLGAPWAGLAVEGQVRRALLGALALVAVDGAPALVARLNRAALCGGDPVAEAEAAVAASGGAAESAVEALSARHAWSGTVACAAVAAAKGGAPVVPSSNLLWMADLDRTLWLLVSCHGRNDSYPEVAAIRAHHHAETVIGRPLPETWLDPLADAFKDVA